MQEPTEPETPGDHEDPAELLRRARGGDAQAQDRLFALYQERVLRRVRRRMGPALREFDQSIDIAQSAMGDAVRDLDRFRGQDEQELLRWMAVLVENKLRNRARRWNARDRMSPLVAAAAGEDSIAPDPAGKQETPSEVAGRVERIARVHAAIAELPEERRRVIELRDLEQRPWADVAAILGITVKAAERRHARARVQLAALLAREGEDDSLA